MHSRILSPTEYLYRLLRHDNERAGIRTRPKNRRDFSFSKRFGQSKHSSRTPCIASSDSRVRLYIYIYTHLIIGSVRIPLIAVVSGNGRSISVGIISLSPYLPRVSFKAVSPFRPVPPARRPAAGRGPFSMSFTHVPHVTVISSPRRTRNRGRRGTVARVPIPYAVHVRTLGVWQTTRRDLSPAAPLSTVFLRSTLSVRRRKTASLLHIVADRVRTRKK